MLCALADWQAPVHLINSGHVRSTDDFSVPQLQKHVPLIYVHTSKSSYDFSENLVSIALLQHTASQTASRDRAGSENVRNVHRHDVDPCRDKRFQHSKAHDLPPHDEVNGYLLLLPVAATGVTAPLLGKGVLLHTRFYIGRLFV